MKQYFREKWGIQEITPEWVMITVLALSAAIYHCYYAFVGIDVPMRFRPFHVFWLLPIAFLSKANFPDRESASVTKRVFLWMCAFLSMLSVGYIVFQKWEEYSTRLYMIDPVSSLDIVMGLILIAMLLVATYIMIGKPLVILSVIALAYLKFGHLIPARFGGHAKISLQRLVEMEFMTNNGIFGTPIGASASFVFLFMLFGAFLELSHTGDFLIDWATGLFGAQKGGPAKVAVISSGLMGMISGSPTSNVVTTGVFTIPMMQRVGYEPEVAGAIEATASTGGSIMPPIMGAAAFIMAEFTGVPYLQVAAAAAIPAILYYESCILQVHFHAAKRGLGGLPKDQLPSASKAFREHFNQLFPVCILVVAMCIGYSAFRSALIAMLSVPFCSLLRKNTRMNWRDIVRALISGAKTSVLVCVACATSGIVIGCISMTGLAVRLTTLITNIGSAALLPALILTMLATIVLGMGIPTSAAYITCVAVTAPILTKLGISTFQAHFFVFYYAVLSSITPPVAIAAYAASGIAKADPLKIGFHACRLGIIAFVVPFMFAYAPALLLIGEPAEIALAAVTSIAGTAVLAAGIEGYLTRKMLLLERVLFIIGGLCMIWPGTITDIVGIIVIVIAVALSRRKNV